MPDSPVWHILASPRYAHGTIAVNLHGWKDDSMLVKRIATVYELHCIARYWSEIAIISYPLAFNAPIGGDPHGQSS